MDRLTLSQARDALLAIGADAAGVEEAIADPRKSLAETIEYAIAGDHSDLAAEVLRRTIAILRALVAHIDFQEGRAFELAAVKEALAEHVRGAKPAEFPALVAFGLVINSGLHHAEPAPIEKV